MLIIFQISIQFIDTESEQKFFHCHCCKRVLFVKRKGTIMPKIERIRVILFGIFLDGQKRNNFLLQKIAILCHSLKKRLSKELWKNALQALFANLRQSVNTWTFVSNARLPKPKIFIWKFEFFLKIVYRQLCRDLGTGTCGNCGNFRIFCYSDLMLNQ